MKYCARLLSILILLSLVVCSSQTSVIETYPQLYMAQKSDVFSVSANDKNLFVEDYKDIHYVHFSFHGKIQMMVMVPDTIDKFEISPKSYDINARSDGKQLAFCLQSPRKIVIYINDYERLFIFADPIEANQPTPAADNVMSILEYDIDNTGNSVQTARIQKAIDDAAGSGKILFFPVGVYLTGTLNLKSDSHIHIAGGAMIKGSPDRSDYPQDEGWNEADEVNDPENYTNKGWSMTYSRLLLIGEAENVKVTGRGVIDGCGAILRPQGKPANLIRIRRSKHVEFDGLILRDPAAWNTHILASDQVIFRNAKILNDRDVKNTDGINPDASTHVTIDDCFMYCSDDNIAIKTSGNSGLLGNVEYIEVKNCVLLTKKSALKLGTETRGDYQRHIAFRNNDIVEADRGISLYSSDGAKFEDLKYINNRFERFWSDNQQKTMLFRICTRSFDFPGYEQSIGHIKNVLIKDCSFEKHSPKDPTFSGFDAEHTISGVHFENFVIDGNVCRNAEDARLKMNEFVKDVTFSESEHTMSKIN